MFREITIRILFFNLKTIINKKTQDGDVDELEQAIMQFMGVDRVVDEIQLRKFRQLKISVLWLQKEQKFGRYCYYGCYCLPEGSHNIAAGGYGKPLDPIDRACLDFKNCYKCLLDEHEGECKGEDIGYRMDLLEDQYGNKSIECTNKVNSCRYNICQCDKDRVRDHIVLRFEIKVNLENS